MALSVEVEGAAVVSPSPGRRLYAGGNSGGALSIELRISVMIGECVSG